MTAAIAHRARRGDRQRRQREAEFNLAWSAVLVEFGAAVASSDDHMTRFSVNTLAGVLLVTLFHLHDYPSTNPWVGLRFEDSERAKRAGAWDVNPHSGKWNIQCEERDTADTAARRLRSRLALVCLGFEVARDRGLLA